MMSTETLVRPLMRPRPSAVIACVRWREVLLLQATPLMGAVFSIGHLSSAKILEALVFTVASISLVASVWTLNDWSDGWLDEADLNKRDQAHRRRGVASLRLLCLSLVFLGVAFGILAFLPLRTFLASAGIAVLGALYSLPVVGGKRIPVYSSVLHFAGGIVHFGMGFSLFAPLDWRCLLISVFFALVFVAGHATQEVQDCTSDRLSRIRTSAVLFGPVPIFVGATILFGVAYAFLIALGLCRVVPLRLAFVAVFVFPIQIAYSVRAFRSGLGFDEISALRDRYRVLFGLIGLAIASLLLK